VIFRAVGRSLRIVGIVTPRQPLDPDAGHVPIVGRVDIRRGPIVAHEAWYGAHDGTCCASGRATTNWTYATGTLRPARTVVEHEPSR
jgi:hypothetical protein